MALDNSTSNPYVPRSQLSLADIIIITVYFALNVAVGIWVRGLGRVWGLGSRSLQPPRHLPQAAGAPGVLLLVLG